MDPAVGKIGTVVTNRSLLNDVNVDIPGVGQYGYPSFVLELVTETSAIQPSTQAVATPTFKVGDRVRIKGYSKEWDGDGVIDGFNKLHPIVRFDRSGFFDRGGFETKYVSLLPTSVQTQVALSGDVQSRAFTAARNLAVKLGKQNPGRRVTIDWVQDELSKLGYSSADLGNAAGSIFKGPFRNTGMTAKSLRPGNRKRRITVWEYVGA